MIIVVKNRNGWEIELGDMVWNGAFTEIKCDRCAAVKTEMCGYIRTERIFNLDPEGEYIFDDGFMYRSQERSRLNDIKKEIHLELFYSPELPFYKERVSTLGFFKKQKK